MKITLSLLGLSLAVSALPLRAAAPLLEKTDVFVGGQDGVREYRIPALVVSKQGTLLAFCDARVRRQGDPPNYIRLVLKRSTDQGRTWGPLQTVVDPGQGSADDTCALVDRQTGTIWAFDDYCPEGVGSGNAIRGLTGATVSYKGVRSDDDGLTWSAPIDITAMVKKPEWRAGSFGPGAGIQTRSGRLVLPRYYTDSPVGEAERSTSSVCTSDDHGKTWVIGGDTATGKGTNECQVAELGDGSLLLNMRGITGNHRRISRSRDGGATWSPVAEDPALIEPRCQASLVSLGGDRLVFSNPASRQRKNMTILLSEDGGKTWAARRSLQPGPAAYSCLAILPDQTIGCLYEEGAKKPYEKIVFARCDTAWIEGGGQ